VLIACITEMVGRGKSLSVASSGELNIFSFADCPCSDFLLNSSIYSTRCEKNTSRNGEQNSKNHSATQLMAEELEKSIQERQTHQKDLFLELRKLYHQADENDNNNKIDMALLQYDEIRRIIKASPASGGLSAIDAKAACSMGMIYELEKHDLMKALDNYFSALEFYSETVMQINDNLKDDGSKKKQKLIDQLNERICVLLVRIASVRAKQGRWENCIQKSEEAQGVLKSILYDAEALKDCEELSKRIEELLKFSRTNLMIKDQC